MSERGILYMIWGSSHERYLQRSIASVKRQHPDLPIHVHRQEHGDLLEKARTHDVSPFETTLFLDVDTVVLGDLTFAFEMAELHGLACCICEAPWASRYGGLSDRLDLIEYNTGVLAFSREKTRSLFADWNWLSDTLDTSIRFYGAGDKLDVMPNNDQGSFAAAVEKWGSSPFVLPMNWNLRPQWHKSLWGPIRIWHDYRDVPQSLIDWNQDQGRPGAVIRYIELRNDPKH